MNANENRIELSLPFCGFYESLLSSELDRVEEQEAEHLAEYSDEYSGMGLDAGDYCDAFFWTCDYGAAYRDIARAYATVAARALSELVGEPVELAFSRLVSPKEYNFGTDELCVYVTPELWARMVREVRAEDMARVAKARHTSCDGFVSFYSPVWETWGDPAEYDDVQRDTLFRAWLELHAEKLAEMVDDHYCAGPARNTAADNLAAWCEAEMIGDENGFFYDVFQDSVDWPAFDARVKQMAADKAATENN